MDQALMAKKSLPKKTLADYEREHRQLAERLSEVGFLWPGSLTPRYLSCGSPRCGCRNNPAARHGPYYYWTTKQGGKTVSRKLPPEEAHLLEQWIGNRREVKSILDSMMTVSEKALPLLLDEEAARRDAKSRR
jgi:hypothetical protein